MPIDAPGRYEVRWKIIFKVLGRNCKRCRRRYPAVVYDLHHPKGKKNRNDTPTRIIRFAPEKEFLRHLKTWELLCANCHRLHHATNGWYPTRKKRKRGNCLICKKQIVSDAPRIFTCKGKCRIEYARFLSRTCQRKRRNGEL